MTTLYKVKELTFIHLQKMSIQEVILTPDRKKQILGELVSCFAGAKGNKEAVFQCMNVFAKRFSKMSYNSSQTVSEFAIEMIRLTTILFQENSNPMEFQGKDRDHLDPEEKSRYRYQLKQALNL